MWTQGEQWEGSLPSPPLPSPPLPFSPLPSPLFPFPPLPLFSLHSAAEERVKWVFWAKGFVQKPANDCWDSKAELLQNSSVYFRSDLLRHKKHSSVYKYINILLIHNWTGSTGRWITQHVQIPTVDCSILSLFPSYHTQPFQISLSKVGFFLVAGKLSDCLQFVWLLHWKLLKALQTLT